MKLRLTIDFFEEHQVKNFRHIYSSVKHIYRNCYLRHFIFFRKIINQALAILYRIVYNFHKTLKFRVLLIKLSKYSFGMLVILCKYNSLSNFSVTINSQPFSHQFINNLFNCIFIKHPFINIRVAYFIWYHSIFFNKCLFIFFFFGI